MILQRPVSGGVRNARRGEALPADAAGVAAAAGPALLVGLIARDGGAEIHAQRARRLDDLGLGQRDQRRMDAAWGCPSTPAFVARAASCSKAAMNSGRQSG